MGGVNPAETHPFRRFEASFDVFEPDTREWEPRREIPRPTSNLNPRDPQQLITSPNGEPFFATFWADPNTPAIHLEDPVRIYSLEEGDWEEIELSGDAKKVLGPFYNLPLMLSPTAEHLRLIGGINYSPGAVNHDLHSAATVLEFSRLSGRWGMLENLETRRDSAAGSITKDGNMFVTGGMTTDVISGFPSPEEYYKRLTGTEVYESGSGKWAAASDSPHPHFLGTALALSDSRILVAGGGNATDVDLYDPRSDTWNSIGNISRTGTNLSIAESTSGHVFIAGGSDVSWIDVLDLSTLTWSQLNLPSGMDIAGTISSIGREQFLVTGSGAVNAAILEASTRKTPLIYVPFAYRYARSP